jgi:hypothetical protein
VNIRYTDRTLSPNTGNFNITVLNTGSRHVNISAIYFEGINIMNSTYILNVWDSSGSAKSLVHGTYLIVVGDSLTFAFDKGTAPISGITIDNVYSIVVITVDGVKVSQDWLATKAV